MAGIEPGFRVFDGAPGDGPRDGGGARRIIVYRLDPLTCTVSELAGARDELFGYPREEWQRVGFWVDHLHPDDRDAASAFWRGWAEAPRSHEMQFRLIDASGRVVCLHDTVEVERRPDGGHEIRGVLVDITERMARDAEMQSALRLRDELLRIVTRDLAEPVRTISSYAGLLGRHLAAQQDHVGGDYDVAIRGAAARLEALLAQLVRVAQARDTGIARMAERLSEIRDTEHGRD